MFRFYTFDVSHPMLQIRITLKEFLSIFFISKINIIDTDYVIIILICTVILISIYLGLLSLITLY